MVTITSAYRVNAGENLTIKSRTEIARAATNDNADLSRAIEIGIASGAGMASPILTDKESASCAYLLMKTGWPEDRMQGKVDLFPEWPSRRIWRKQPLFRGRKAPR